MIRNRWALAPIIAMAALSVATGAGAQERAGGADVATLDATRGRDLEEGQKLRVRIRNDLIPTRSMTVSLVTPTRPELVLGIVPSLSSREWEIDTRLVAGGFRLVATGDPRDVRVSRRIDVQSQANVTWKMGLGIVRIERVVDDDAGGAVR